MNGLEGQKQFVEVHGLRIGYLKAGVGDPLVFIHGWPTYSYMWRRQIPAFAEHFRVYALDLPGFGDSDKPPDEGYTLGFFVRVLDDFLDGMGVDRVSVVCHDLGGPIALLWAVRHPERLDKLAILDTMPYPDLPLMVRLMLLFARLPVLGAAMVGRRGLRLSLRIGTVGTGVVTDELVAAYARPFEGDPATRKTLLRILTELEPEEMVEIAENLGLIKAPTLVLWAERDPSAPLGIAQRLQADIDDAVLRTLPDCGHFMTEDRPEEVNRLLLEFLR